jgi:hypothetical protein
LYVSAHVITTESQPKNIDIVSNIKIYKRKLTAGPNDVIIIWAHVVCGHLQLLLVIVRSDLAVKHTNKHIMLPFTCTTTYTNIYKWPKHI